MLQLSSLRQPHRPANCNTTSHTCISSFDLQYTVYATHATLYNTIVINPPNPQPNSQPSLILVLTCFPNHHQDFNICESLPPSRLWSYQRRLFILLSEFEVISLWIRRIYLSGFRDFISSHRIQTVHFCLYSVNSNFC